MTHDERTLDPALHTVLDAALPVRSPVPPSPDEVERALHAVLARRGGPARARHALAPARNATRWLTAAAVLAAVALSALLLNRERTAITTVASALVLQTRIGQVDSVRLADGSLAVLAPGSRLDTLAGFVAASRTVVLRGEAYFDVVHDAARPFTVLTAHASLRDVGTRFTVRADVGGASVVSVQEGAVDARARSADAPPASRLTAGDRAMLSGTGAVRVERGAVTVADAAWTRGHLVLRDAPQADVADAMRRWYGIEFVVEDSVLRMRRVTASFGGESGADAARVVAAAMGGAASVRGDTVRVRPITATVP